MEKRGEKNLACFISPHGFGHAARAAAILEQLIEMDGACHFHLFTTVPGWFFDFPLFKHFSYHCTLTDIGFVQRSPFLEDFDKTARRLDAFLPFDPALIDGLAAKLCELNCRAVLCDIAPLGIAVARKAGLPSVLVENFTWDWLYAGYAGFSQRVKRHIDYLSSIFEMADHRIQSEPVCRPVKSRLALPPIFRVPRTDAQSVRKRLNIPDDCRMVLISLGGIPDRVQFTSTLAEFKDFRFVIPGAGDTTEFKDNIRLLPPNGDFYHPDLVHAADIMIGKAGYSTIAEVFGAGIPFGFVPRPDFPESPVLSEFIKKRMPSVSIPMERFYAGDWMPLIQPLLALLTLPVKGKNGAPAAARYVANLMGI